MFPQRGLDLKRAQKDGLYFVLLGAAIFVFVGFSLEHRGKGWMEDFKAVYYATRCLLQHHDPYSPSEVLRTYMSETGADPSEPALNGQRQGVTVNVYPPPTFFILSPIALLSWGLSHTLWMITIAISFVAAAALMWKEGVRFAPVVSGALIGFLLANAFSLILVGNTAGLVVSLCVIAVSSFVRQRFTILGVVCLAICLVIKPHDAGLVWLFFLLDGGRNRKRALQSLLVAALIAIPSILWVSSVSPNWMQEAHSNLIETSGPMGRDNPGPSSLGSRTAGMIVDLQAVISVFRDDPHFYNLLSYLVCAGLLVAWSVPSLTAPSSPTKTWLALAAVSALSMLPSYHRVYDAKLLLLTIPACAMLWARGGVIRWLAVAITGTGLILTADFPLALLVSLTKHLELTSSGIANKILAVLLVRPAPIALFIVCVFYLAIYVSAFLPRGRKMDSEEQTARAVAS
jgi:Glycosyltransferase family 87